MPGQLVQDLFRAMDLIKSESRRVVQKAKAEVEKDGLGSLGRGRDLITLLCELSLSSSSTFKAGKLTRRRVRSSQ